jgi:hypothetical protein
MKMKKFVLSLTIMSMVLLTIYACTQEYTGTLLPKQDENTGKWGYVDTTGKTVITPKWDEAGIFSEGLAAVKLKLTGKYGFIDKTGKEIIPVQYDKVGPFSGGLAEVELEGKYGTIDKTGKETAPFRERIFEITALTNNTVELKILKTTNLYNVVWVSNAHSYEASIIYNSVGTIYWSNGSEMWAGSSIPSPKVLGADPMKLLAGSILTIQFNVSDSQKPEKIGIFTDKTATPLYYNISKSTWE